MGQTTSNVVKKVVSPVSYVMGWSNNGQNIDDQTVARLANPFVYKRRGYAILFNFKLIRKFIV